MSQTNRHSFHLLRLRHFPAFKPSHLYYHRGLNPKSEKSNLGLQLFESSTANGFSHWFLESLELVVYKYLVKSMALTVDV